MFEHPNTPLDTLLLAVLLRLGIIILTVLLRLLAMLLLRDYLFDGLATATGGVTTPLPKDHLIDSCYGYWRCYYAGIIFSTV